MGQINYMRQIRLRIRLRSPYNLLGVGEAGKFPVGIYRATPATNQPLHLERELYFISNGQCDLLVSLREDDAVLMGQ